MRNPAPLAMMDDRIVGQIADGVGLVVADDEIAFVAERPQERLGHARESRL